MYDITKFLQDNSDKKYREFQIKLVPNINHSVILGVRIPLLRKYAKKLIFDNNYIKFLSKIPHKYYDENNLHVLILSLIKNYNFVINEVNKFLPQIDNWMTCDILRPICFYKNKFDLIKNIKKWIKSKHIFTIRFGIEMLMLHFLDKEFKKEYFDIVTSIKNDNYYVKMMISWFFASALINHYDDVINILKNPKLDYFIKNKIIQKGLESFRINNKKKVFLKKLRCKIQNIE